MNKRSLIIVVATICCIGLGSLIYYTVNNDLSTLSTDLNPDGRFKDDPIPQANQDINAIGSPEMSVGSVEKFHFIKPGEREFGFDSRIPQGDNTLTISKPWVKIFSRTGKTIVIMADSGSVPVDIEGSELKLPSNGSLDSHVTLQIYPTILPNGNPQEIDPAEKSDPEFTVTMNHIDFEREFSRIVSRGPIAFHTRAFQASGRNLFLQYDQINERLQELEIEFIDEVLIDYGSDIFSSLNLTDQQSGASSETSEEPIPDVPEGFEFVQPDTQHIPPAVYRLLLSREVIVAQGEKRLTADSIEVLAGLDLKKNPVTNSAKKQATSERSNSGQSDDSNQTSQVQSPLVRLTCEGPLRITGMEDPIRIKELQDKIFISAFGTPAGLWIADKPILLADSISFSQTNQRMVLLAGPDRPITLQSPDNLLSVTAGHSIQINPQDDLILVNGPGLITFSDPNQATRIQYRNSLKLSVSDLIHATEPDFDITGNLRTFEFLGPFTVDADPYLIEAAGGSFYVAPPPDNIIATDPILERFNLIRASIRSPYGTFSGDSITGRLDSDPNWPNCLILRELTVNGNVAMTSDKYQFQTDGSLFVHFDANRTDPNDLWNRPFDQKLSDKLIFIDKLNPTWLLAQSEQGQVHFINNLKHFSLQGNRLEGRTTSVSADLENGSWDIQGRDAVIVYQDSQSLQGRHMTLDPTEQICHMFGSGQIEMAGSFDLLGQTPEVSQTPVLLHLTWQDGADYDLLNNRASFYNTVIQNEQTGLTNWRHTTLSCPRLIIDYQPAAKTSSKNRQPNDITEIVSLQLNADGPVYVESRDFQNDTNDLISTSRIFGNRLSFDNSSRQLCLTGPGWIDHINFQNPQSKPATSQPVQQNNFNTLLADALPGDRSDYTLVRFSDTLRYEIRSGFISIANGVTVIRLPLDPQSNVIPDPEQPVAGSMRLFCQDLTISPDDPAGEKTTVQANNSLLKAVNRLQATGNVYLEFCRDDFMPDFFISKTLTFDRISGDIFIQGAPNRPAQYIGRDLRQSATSHIRQTRFQWIRYNIQTNLYEGEELEGSF